MPATVGVPREIKEDEGRVAITPSGVHLLREQGHRVVIERNAGSASGIADEEFEEAGAEILPTAAELFRTSTIIAKVKEPQPEEYGYLRRDLCVFTFFHFAASRELTQAMMDSGATCVAYETIQDDHGRLPILTPMSEVAGRMSVLEGAKYLQGPAGGRGVLISGVPGVEPAQVVILGAGVVGSQAARIAAGVGADVALFDVNLERLRHLAEVMPPNVTLLHSDPFTIRRKVWAADLVVGAVLVTGAKAPVLVRRQDVRRMKDRSVIVDVSVDQGGCIETCRPTTHSHPTYLDEGVLHYCVSNMPGAVARTSTLALTAATLPYLKILADHGTAGLFRLGPGVSRGLNIHAGKIYHEGVSAAFGLPYHPLPEITRAIR